jgi:hypothetical protein
MASSESSTIYLIDYGVSQRYIDLNGNHMAKQISVFRGNLLFASATALLPMRKTALINTTFRPNS